MVSSKKKILKNLANTYCRIKFSRLSGVGVFAIRDISSGINPFTGAKNQKWIKFRVSELKGLDGEIFRMVDDFFVIEEDSTIYIPETGLNGIDISFFVNHSKNHNLKYLENSQNFMTIKKIKKGQELTADYSSYDPKYA